MAGRPGEIVCRRCDTVFPLAEGNCPECGTGARGRLAPAVVVAVGLFMLLTSLSPFETLYVGTGLVLIGLGAAAHRGRHRRIVEARERRGFRRPPVR